MKKNVTKLISTILAMSILFSLFLPSAFAASGDTKAHLIQNKNEPVYEDASLKHQIGTTYGTDELIILKIDGKNKLIKIRFKLDKGGTKEGWLKLNKVLLAASGKSYKSTGTFKTYWRDSTANVFGSVSPKDFVEVLGEKGSFTQIRYSLDVGGYKVGFAKTSDVKKYVTGNTEQNNGLSWQWPVSSYSTSQSFGHYSSAMAKKGRAYHAGVDLVSSKHAIYAAADGTVSYRGYSSGNGNHVILRHTLNSSTVYTLYSHLDDFSGCPKVNQSVSRGDRIGTMGNTGNSTGTHLHFAVFIGSSNDPYGYTSVNSSSRMSYKGCTFYNPATVISKGKLS